jgi:large subunit ribosomal protein L10
MQYRNSSELLTSDAVFEPMQGKQPYGCVGAKHHFWSLTVGLNRNEKQAVVEEISAKIASAQTIALAEYRGIQVGQMTQLRSKARDQGVYLRVLKNTLARRAVEGTTFSGLANDMTGPLIYAISDDAVAAAKVLSDFAKGNDKLVIRSGNYAGKPLDKAGVAALANIPSREVLLSQLMGIMQAPVSGFARALAALAEKNGGGAPAEAAAPAEAG